MSTYLEDIITNFIVPSFSVTQEGGTIVAQIINLPEFFSVVNNKESELMWTSKMEVLIIDFINADLPQEKASVEVLEFFINESWAEFCLNQKNLIN